MVARVARLFILESLVVLLLALQVFVIGSPSYTVPQPLGVGPSRPAAWHGSQPETRLDRGIFAMAQPQRRWPGSGADGSFTVKSNPQTRVTVAEVSAERRTIRVRIWLIPLGRQDGRHSSRSVTD
jgi:hypothetical protein